MKVEVAQCDTCKKLTETPYATIQGETIDICCNGQVKYSSIDDHGRPLFKRFDFCSEICFLKFFGVKF